MGLEIALWRALTVFRAAALGYAAVLLVGNFRHYARPVGGWLVVAAMAAWTGYTIWAYAQPRRRGWPLLAADLLVAAACLLASRWVVRPSGLVLGSPTLPMAWVSAPVIAWAVAGGRRLGVLAAALMGAADVVVRDGISQATINGTVLMLLAGVVVGHMARLAVEAEQRLQRAVELEAATRERDRLARGIHDSVLQVLALVQRRGAEIGGEAAELGRLAGAQGATLRALITAGAATDQHTRLDLRTLVERCAGERVTVAIPATAVWLPAPDAREIAAAVAGALDNVRRHAGEAAQAWLLVEDEPETVTVTVRDNGPGFAAGRLEQACADGRFGVAHSIIGRMRDLGGSATVTATPGGGTEVELRLPRSMR